MKRYIIILSLLILSGSSFGQSKYNGSRQSKEEFLNDEYCTGLFNTADGQYFDLMDDRLSNTAMGYINILDWLQGRVAGLQVYGTGMIERVAYLRNQKAAVFVDEMYMGDDITSMIPVMDIAMIKIIRSPTFSHWAAPGGAIAIYTKGGEDSTMELEAD